MEPGQHGRHGLRGVPGPSRARPAHSVSRPPRGGRLRAYGGRAPSPTWRVSAAACPADPRDDRTLLAAGGRLGQRPGPRPRGRGRHAARDARAGPRGVDGGASTARPATRCRQRSPRWRCTRPAGLSRGRGRRHRAGGGLRPAAGFELTLTSVARYVFDLGDWERSAWVVPLGASGHPASPHYADQSADWAAVRLRPMRYDWVRVAAESESRQRLEPAPAELVARDQSLSPGMSNPRAARPATGAPPPALGSARSAAAAPSATPGPGGSERWSPSARGSWGSAAARRAWP